MIYIVDQNLQDVQYRTVTRSGYNLTSTDPIVCILLQSTMFCVYITFYRGNKLPPFYIGSTSIKRLNSGYSGSPMSKEYGKIWKAEKLSNPHLFSTRLLSTCRTREEAFNKERFLHEQLNVVQSPLYVNKMIANDHVRMVGKHTEEARLKMSAAQQGRKHPDQVKQKIAAGNRGKPKSQEHRRALSEAAKNRSPEHLARIGEAGRNRSAETRLKLSLHAKNRTPEHKAKLYANAKGRTFSEEARAKMSAAGKGRPKSEEWKAKMRAIWTAKRAKAALEKSGASG